MGRKKGEHLREQRRQQPSRGAGARRSGRPRKQVAEPIEPALEVDDAHDDGNAVTLEVENQTNGERERLVHHGVAPAAPAESDSDEDEVDWPPRKGENYKLWNVYDMADWVKEVTDSYVTRNIVVNKEITGRNMKLFLRKNYPETLNINVGPREVLADAAKIMIKALRNRLNR